MSYRLFNPAPVFFNSAGVDPIPGGSIQFYAIGTTTPKDTYSDQALTVANSNPVPLGVDARLSDTVWLDGEYTIVIKDVSGNVVHTDDVTDGNPAGASIPALVNGQFLTNDGSNLLWQDIIQVPDPTDSVDYILSTDGINVIWIPQATIEIPDFPIANTTSSLKIGTALFQWGGGTIPANPSSKTSSFPVTFPTAFIGTPYTIVPTVSQASGSTGSGASPVLVYSNLSSTGCTITANIPDDDSNAVWKLGFSTPFTYIVIGPTTSDS